MPTKSLKSTIIWSSVSSSSRHEPSPLTLATLAELPLLLLLLLLLQLLLLLLPLATCTPVGQERLSTSQPRRRHNLSAGARASIRRTRWLSASRSSLSRPSGCRALITSAGVSPSLFLSFSSAPQRSRSSTPLTLECLQATCSGVSSRGVRALTFAPPSNRA
ncbi:unnamed protein product [Ectocarpus sp. 12 AP-2014]